MDSITIKKMKVKVFMKNGKQSSEDLEFVSEGAVKKGKQKEERKV